jgi:hypothetical protein
MANRQRKKRNKVYTGEDAKVVQPTVHRYQAVNRSALGEWWQKRKKIVKNTSLYGGGFVFIVLLIISAITSH